MRCRRCNGCLLWSEEYIRCANCGDHSYPPLPSTPERTRCYHCSDAPMPGKMSCAACLERDRVYRQTHPKKHRKIGPQLPVVQEVQ